MAKPSASGSLAQEVIRVGVGQFVTRFARRFRVDGLPAKLAAQVAARELAQEAICGFLGIPQPGSKARFRPGGDPTSTPVKKIAPRAHSGATAKGSAARRKPDPELERLKRLKRFVDGTGPGHRPERKKAR